MKASGKIKIVSTIMVVASVLAMIFVIMGSLFFWWADLLGVNSKYLLNLSQPSWGAWKLLGFILNFIPEIIIALGINQLRLFFLEYTKEKFFMLNTIKHFHGFAWAVMIYGISRPFLGAANNVILHNIDPEGHGPIVLTLNSSHLTWILVGLIFLSVSWVMMEAGKVAKENSEFI